MEDVRIRPMEAKDFKAAALIMAQAFGGKMPAMRKESPRRIADFMLAGGVFDVKTLSRHYVAVVQGEVAGIMHLETLEDKRQNRTPTKDAMYLFRKFGVFRVMISSVSLLFLENHLAPDEMIVDFIAVAPKYRGLGIGTKLLDVAEEVAKNCPGIRRHTIGVIDSNKGARKLYERHGFVLYQSKNSLIRQWLTGVRRAHMLEKRFEEQNAREAD